MRKLFFLLLLVIHIVIVNAQTVTGTYDIGNGPQTGPVTNGMEISVQAGFTGITSLALNISTVAANHKYIVRAGAIPAAGGSNEYLVAHAGTPRTFSFQSNIINTEIQLIDVDITTGAETPFMKFKFVQTAGAAPVVPPKKVAIIEPLSDYLSRIMANYKLTSFGWVSTATTGLTAKEKKDVINVSHIFLDEFGNSLLGTMPQGISNRQYVAHIIYAGYSDRQGEVRYSIKQKTGSFNSALNVNNTGILSKLPDNFQNAIEYEFDEWKEEVFPLGIATDDLTFEVIASTRGDNNKPVKVVLETQTIKMSPVYHATMDIGLINSELNNATYTLVDGPDGLGDKVVKQTDRSPTGIVTVMATFYTSPIVILEKLFEKKLKKPIPNYKMTGRSFFDDHAFFERIYPTVGVSVSSEAFENLFFGLNWELARGLSIFAGGHWGKVNTFEMPGFVAGITPVTEAEYEFYKNSKWKVDLAYGVKLDIVIVTNLFK